MRTNVLIYTIAFVMTVMACGCSRVPQWRVAEGAAWHTVYHVTYRASDDLSDSVVAVMRRVELSVSPFESRSRLSAINTCVSDEADSLILRLFVVSQAVNGLSRGMFDPTVAPLVSLWGFGHENTARLPSPSEIDSVMAFVGIAGCRIEGLRIHKKSPQTQFNFSAAAKGLGCDEVAGMLRRNGCSDYMVEIGGEVVVGGCSPRGGLWNIMVEKPIDSDSAIVSEELTRLNLTDCGVATSGNYRNFKSTLIGKVAHTIDPVTGRPTTLDSVAATLSATVVAPDAMTADALATACMLLPASDALTMVKAMNARALIVTPDSVFASPGLL